jgi:hypothetical protein
MGFDYTGTAVLIGAVGVFVTTTVSAGISVATFIRAGHAQRAATAATKGVSEVKQEVVDLKHNTDGMSEALNKALAGEAFAKGQAKGVFDERTNQLKP